MRNDIVSLYVVRYNVIVYCSLEFPGGNVNQDIYQLSNYLVTLLVLCTKLLSMVMQQ